MTFREKLADWINGGALSEALKSADESKDYLVAEMFDAHQARTAIQKIHEYTAPQKSGTAKKVARMCEEALK